MSLSIFIEEVLPKGSLEGKILAWYMALYDDYEHLLFITCIKKKNVLNINRDWELFLNNFIKDSAKQYISIEHLYCSKF